MECGNSKGVVRDVVGYRLHPYKGTISICRESDGTFTVVHSDLYAEYMVTTGFKTFAAARTEAAMYTDTGKW